MREPPTRRPQASALSYKRGSRAPQIVASGVGLTAERIVASARDAGVPVRQDQALAQALGLLDLGDSVPEALFTAVAETLAWAYRLDKRAGASERAPR